MFVLKKKQLEVFKEIERKKFVEKSLGFLKYNFPEWVTEKEDDELKVFINKIIDLGEEYHLLKEIHAQKLMFLKISYDFKIPLTDKHHEILKPQMITAEKRIKNFFKALEKGNKNIVIKAH